MYAKKRVTGKSCGKQAVRSRRMILDGLMRLMEKEPYELITITQICQESQIARQTFYRNYDSKNDILTYYIRERLLERARENTFGDDFEKNLRTLFFDFPISKELISLMRKNGLFYLLEEQFLGFMPVVTDCILMPKLLGTPDYDDFLNQYIVSSILSILTVWTDHGFRESAEQLSAISIQFFKGTADEKQEPE